MQETTEISTTKYTSPQGNVVHLQIRISKPLNFHQDSLGIETAQGFSELERGVCHVRINKYRS